MKRAIGFLLDFKSGLLRKFTNGPRAGVFAGALLGLALFPATSFAQRAGRTVGGGFGEGRERGPVQMDEQTVMDVTVEILHLSDAQKQQVQAMFDAANATAAPIVAQMQGSESALFDAVKLGRSDDQIKSMAQQQGALRGQILQLQAETFAKLWAILSNEQKSEVGILIYNGIGQFLNMAHSPLPATNPNATAVPPGSPAPAKP